MLARVKAKERFTEMAAFDQVFAPQAFSYCPSSGRGLMFVRL